MASAPRRHQVLSNTTITANGNSGLLPNLDSSKTPTVVAYLDIPNAPTGTSPSLTVSILGTVDGARFSTLGSFSAQTAQLSGPVRLVLHDVLEQNLEVSWAITGASASFTGVNLDLLFSSPDA